MGKPVKVVRMYPTESEHVKGSLSGLNTIITPGHILTLGSRCEHLNNDKGK